VAEDAEGIVAVHVRTWQVAYVDYFTKEYLDGQSRFLTASNIEQRREQLSSSQQTTFVAEDDGTILGFATVAANRDGLGKEVGELGAIYVDPDRWNYGVGSALLEAAEASLKESGYTSAVLWTIKANSRTRRFYENHGWKLDGAEKPFRTGVDLIRYARALG
jgi:GNAT superfamily N-acetyltransferase